MKSCQLTARSVTAAKKPGYYGDGGGLYLQVSKYGTRNWIFRFTMDHKTRDMGLGSLETFSLKEARDRARRARQLVADGIDPIEQRNQERDARRKQESEQVSFKDAAQRFLDVHQTGWKNEKHRAQWKSTLTKYAYPTLGTRPLSAIDGSLVTETLSPIWTKKPETAQRVKQRIERVIQWVKDGQPLPSPGARKRGKHHAAMPFVEIPAFMDDLRERVGISARALEFTILNAARTGDVIGAKWKEVDLKVGVWTVSDGRHKTGKEFEIPLSKRAVLILKALPREKGSPYVFPGARAKAPLSNMAMLELLRGMKANGLTVHGFRSSFRDWAGDRTNFAREVIEAAMSHQIKDKAEAAYRRSTALDKRRKLMEAWAHYCASPAAPAEVVPFKSRAR